MRASLIACLALACVSCGDTKRPPAVADVPHIGKGSPAPLRAPDRQTESPTHDAGVPEATGAQSGQEARKVLEAYYALIADGSYAEAWKLRWKQRSSRSDEAAFAATFDRYAEYRANVGEPGEVQGAAGSFYVDIPVQIYGRLRDGSPFSSAGTVTMRRANVPGSTAAERRWRIYTSG